MELSGKTAVLTGASGGIGTALARALAGAGAALLLCGRNAERLAALRRELGSAIAWWPPISPPAPAAPH